MEWFCPLCSAQFLSECPWNRSVVPLRPEIPETIKSILTLNCNSSFSMGMHHLHLNGENAKDLNQTIELLHQYPHYVIQSCCQHCWLLVDANDCHLQCGNHARFFRKHCSQPYLDQLLSDKKTVEGRVREGVWSQIRTGDVIEFFDGDLSGTFQVKNLHPTESFGALFRMFRQKLLPGVYHEELAEQIYAQWFSPEKIQKYKVVGVEVIQFNSQFN